MKTNKIICAALATLVLASCSPKKTAQTAPEATEGEKTEQNAEKKAEAKKNVDPKTLLPSKSLVDSVSYLLGINFGSLIKGNNFGDLNYKQIERGMKEFINAKGNQRDTNFVKQFKVNPNEMNEIFNGFLSKRHDYVSSVNAQKEEKFLAANAKKKDFQTTPSGLQYRVIEAGNDVKPGPKDTVFVRYKGTLEDGTVFDETPEGAKPVRMLLNRVVKGWQEGLAFVGEGGKIELVVPSKLGYGERGNQLIEPNTPLIFEVALDSVKHYIEKPKPDVKKK